MAIGVWAVAAWAVASLAVTEPGRLVTWAPLAALICLTIWAVFWAPKVVVGPERLEVRNVAATYEVPWAAISHIDTKWALTLYTTGGRITAFAAPAPSGLRAEHASGSAGLRHLPESTFDAGRSARPGDVPGTASGDLAWVIRERWEKVRDAVPTGSASGAAPIRRWHVRTLAAWAALAVVTALTQVLA
jgi:hypothetical protein